MKIIIDGAGEIGSHLAKRLSQEGKQVSVIDSDQDRLQALMGVADIEGVLGNPTSMDVLKKAGVANTDLFVSVFPYVNQEVNIVVCFLAKKLGAKKCIARVADPQYLDSEGGDMMKDLGIELLVCPEKIAADEIVEQLKHHFSSDSIDFSGGGLQILSYKIGEFSPLLDITLKKFVDNFPAQFRIIAVARWDQTIIPKQDFRFRYGDMVYITIKTESVEQMNEYLGVQDIDINRVMIMGGGSIGFMAARELCPVVPEVKIVDISRNRCRELDGLLPSNVVIVNGDGRNTDFLFEEGIRDFDAFVAITGNDETNILACVAAKKFGVARAIAEVENLEYVRLAEDMGVDIIINKKLLVAGRVLKYTLHGNAQYLRYLSGTNAEVVEYTVAPGSQITKAPLANISFPVNAVIGGVIRGEESFIPVGTTQIQGGDRVAVFTIPESVHTIDKFFK